MKKNEIKKGYFRFPAIYKNQIVFTAEGNLWITTINGGIAERITTHHNSETNAKFSPDGKYLAFTGRYEGALEIYLITLNGGLPKRITFNSMQSAMINWTADNKIIYRSIKNTGLPNSRLFIIDPETLEEIAIKLNQASDGIYDETGKNLYFTRLPFQGSHTKRYKGGYIEKLWTFDGESEAIPLTESFAGTSKSPMIFESRIYFVSDRDGTMNIWSMDSLGKDLKQHTEHKDFDVKSVDQHEGKIIYQLAGELYIYDIVENKSAKLEITLRSDFDQTREKWITDPIEFLTDYDISHDGKSLLLTSRGKVFKLPVKKGRLIQSAGKEGVRYKHAVTMPDGKAFLSLSDESGEFEFTKTTFETISKEEQLTKDSSIINLDAFPSPDGKHFVYGDKDRRVWLADIEKKEKKEIIRSDYEEITSFTWSPDSNFIAFSIVMKSNFMEQIYIYDLGKEEYFPITTERYDSFSPTWSPDGKWLYFISNRHFDSIVESPWGARQPEPYFPNPSKLYMLDLVGGERSPFLETDEFNEPEEKEDDKKDKDKDKEERPKEKITVSISREGIKERLWEVPVKPGNYNSLNMIEKNLFWLEDETNEETDSSLKMIKIDNEKEPEIKTLVEKIDDYVLSADSKKILVKKEKEFFVIDSSADKIEKWDDFKVDLSKWSFSIDPVKEWKQILVDAWRMERDYFYDKDMHGADYKKLLDIHLPLVDKVTDRDELDDLISLIVGELSALHTFVGGGDSRKGKEKEEFGCLGAELNLIDSKWKISHIYKTEADLPNLKSPLIRPDLDIKDGDIITAIDGVLLSNTNNPHRLLRNKVNTQVLISLERDGEISAHIVKTISPNDEFDMRYSEWEYNNRLKVDKDSSDDIGYVHLRAMGKVNYSEWMHNYYPIFDRKGLIIDVRNNNGGNIDSWILEKLLRKAWFYWQSRDSKPFWNMQYAFRGHIVVLCNERTASDGEAFSEGIRRLGIGKIIGKRTWGGEIWLSMNNLLVDKGIASAAQSGVYGPEREWLIEGHGVEPDYEVDNLPYETYLGKDNQLDFALNYLKNKIEEEPVDVPEAPKFPDLSLK